MMFELTARELIAEIFLAGGKMKSSRITYTFFLVYNRYFNQLICMI